MIFNDVSNLPLCEILSGDRTHQNVTELYQARLYTVHTIAGDILKKSGHPHPRHWRSFAETSCLQQYIVMTLCMCVCVCGGGGGSKVGFPISPLRKCFEFVNKKYLPSNKGDWFNPLSYPQLCLTYQQPFQGLEKVTIKLKHEKVLLIIIRCLSAGLQYLQCVSNGDTAVLR